MPKVEEVGDLLGTWQVTLVVGSTCQLFLSEDSATQWMDRAPYRLSHCPVVPVAARGPRRALTTRRPTTEASPGEYGALLPHPHSHPHPLQQPVHSQILRHCAADRGMGAVLVGQGP